jgi:hypothetical protein
MVWLTSTKQYTSQCIHPTQKEHPLYESASHLMSLCQERMPMLEVSGHGRHLTTYSHKKCCQKNQQHSCPCYSLMIFSLNSKQINYKKVITLSLYFILKKIAAPPLYGSLLKILLPTNMH